MEYAPAVETDDECEHIMPMGTLAGLPSMAGGQVAAGQTAEVPAETVAEQSPVADKGESAPGPAVLQPGVAATATETVQDPDEENPQQPTAENQPTKLVAAWWPDGFEGGP